MTPRFARSRVTFSYSPLLMVVDVYVGGDIVGTFPMRAWPALLPGIAIRDILTGELL